MREYKRIFSGQSLFLLSVTLWLALYLVYASIHPYPVVFHFSYAIGFLIIPSLASLLGGMLSNFKNQSKLVLLLLAGMVITSLGDAFLVFFPASSPQGRSIILWLSLAGALLLILFWIMQPILRRRDFIRVKLLLDMAISTGAISVLAWLLFIQPALTGSSTTFDSFTYTLILIDIGLFAVMLNLALTALQPAIQRQMFVFLLGVLFLAIADITSRFNPLRSLPPGTSVDFGYLIGYSLIAVSLVLQSSPNRNSSHVRQVTDQTLGERIQSVLAVALSLVLIGYLFVFWRQERDIPQTILVFSAMVWLLLIARQGVAAGEFELQQYSLLFNQSAEPAFLCATDYRLILVNNAMLNICQVDSEEQLLGEKLTLFLPGLPRQIASMEKPIELLLKTQKQTTVPIDMVLKIVQLGWLRRKVVTGVIHDLTGQKQQQNELRDALENVNRIKAELEILNNELETRVAEKTQSLSSAYLQLEEQNRMLQDLDRLKSDFVSMVSHELRAPLTNISGGIELLLSGGRRLDLDSRNSLKLVQNEIIRLTRIVENILDLSALDAGRMPIYPEPIHWQNLKNIIEESARSIEDGKLAYHLSDKDAVFLADPQVLGSVFSYLIDNSRKYAPDSMIEITGESDPDRVIISVNDHGPGIPEDMISSIFDKFVRADNSDSREVYGRGLGLYMAKRLIEAMHGTISASNQNTGGARFTITLPVMEEKHV